MGSRLELCRGEVTIGDADGTPEEMESFIAR